MKTVIRTSMLSAMLFTWSATAGAQTGPLEPAEAPDATGALVTAAAEGPASNATAGDVPKSSEHTGIRTLFRDLGHDFLALPSVQNAWIAGIGGAAALAVHPFDDTFNARLQGTGEFFQDGKLMGQTGIQIAGAFGTYAVGRMRHTPRIAHIGMDLLRAQIISETLTEGVKLIARRDRPDGTTLAFSSGHAAVTVATATVVYRHFGLAWSLPVYGMAAYVGASRLHDNRHWLSDVVFGAAVGAVSARTVTRHGRSNYTWAPTYVPGGGIAVMVTRLPRPNPTPLASTSSLIP